MKSRTPLAPGDPVIFSVAKRSACPGLRAREIRPELRGEGYFYIVDKFWVVNERRGEQLVLITRRGKTHLVDEDDPHLHHASWWERLIYRGRFPKPRDTAAQNRLAV